MLISTATTPPVPQPSAVATGMLIARATDRVDGSPVDIVAGKVLRTGVRDIATTGWELVQSTFDPQHREAWGMVAFMRTGDTWAAVELLTKSAAGTTPLWLPSHVADVRVADGVAIDAAWQVSNFGGDYTSRMRDWIAPRT